MKLLSVTKSPYHGKDISTVKVPPELRIKHKTGIEWLDFVLGGGLTPSTAWMVTGVPGGGKTTLGLTIAAAWRANVGPSLYNMREESVYQVKMTAERLALEHFTFGEDVFVGDVIAHLKKLQKSEKKGERTLAVVDSLQCLDDAKYDTGKRTKNTPINCAQQLIAWAKETYGILIFVNHVTKSGRFAGENTLLHAVDAHLHIAFDTNKKSETYGERILVKGKDRFGVAIPPIVLEMGEGGKLSRKAVEPSDEEEPWDDEEEKEEPHEENGSEPSMAPSPSDSEPAAERGGAMFSDEDDDTRAAAE